MPIERPIIIVYHKDCSSRDGFGAAWAAWKKFGMRVRYVPLEHGKDVAPDFSDSDIYTLDFCFKKPQAETLLAHGNTLFIIDHHVSAEPVLPLAQETHFAINHSGAFLAWEYFHPGKPVPLVLSYIEDTDLWRFALPHSREYLQMIKLQPQDFAHWDRMVPEFERSKVQVDWLGKGEMLVEKMRQEISKLVENAEEVEFEGQRCLMVNSPLYTSEIGHVLYSKHPPMAIVWSRRGKKLVVSLRSNGTVDVAKLAEKYGGGGHKPAAGFSIPLDISIPTLIQSLIPPVD